MKKSFTLIELIFVIVIIGLLASIAVPKFMTTKSAASGVSAKGIVSSLRTAIETKHGEWLIDDSLGSSDGYSSTGYPDRLDENNSAGAPKLFDRVVNGSPLLKNPINACKDDEIDCWEKLDTYIYGYRLSEDNELEIEYNNTEGNLTCIDGNNITKEECEDIIN